jgi:hypothetical protein
MPETITIPETVTLPGEDVFKALVDIEELGERIAIFNQGNDTETYYLAGRALATLYAAAFGEMCDPASSDPKEDARMPLLREIEARAWKRIQE